MSGLSLTHTSAGLDADAQSDFMNLEYWRDLLCKVNEMRRYRRIVGSLAGSCLSAATPLLSSTKEAACLVALEVMEVFFFLLLGLTC
jgi:TELO2-interacting protein 1